MRTRTVTVDEVKWTAIVVRYATRCATCDGAYPITPGTPATYRVDGTSKTVHHINCTPREVVTAIASK